MLTTARNKVYQHPLLVDFIYILFFGGISLFFARLSFSIPGLEKGLQSDFREIPLLICIFYVRNPLMLILLSVITGSHTANETPFVLNFGLHAISLIGTWFLYSAVKKNIASYKYRFISWLFIVGVYFYLLLIPSYIFIGYFFRYIPSIKFAQTYSDYYDTLLIEAITASLITGLYLIQYEIRGSLETHKLNLEYVVNERTKELALVNKHLTHLNRNLDEMVKRRSKKIENQLSLLVKYAHMNSHEVRAPLARLLGLVYIIGSETNEKEKHTLLKKIDVSAKELDDVVRKMNRLLEKEIFSPKMEN